MVSYALRYYYNPTVSLSCESVSLSLWVCESASLRVCESASLWVCESVSLWVCESVSLWVCVESVQNTNLRSILQISGRDGDDKTSFTALAR